MNQAFNILKSSVNQGFHFGSNNGSNYSVFCKSKNSLTEKGLSDLNFYLKNGYVIQDKATGWYCFTKKAMAF